MKKYIDPFLYNVPQLDVHGFDRYGAVAMIKNFIDNNYRIDNKKLVIVHGRGYGILRKATHDYLKTDRRVLEYKMEYYNDGQTVVTLK